MDFPFNKDITYFAKTNFRGTDQIFGIKRKDRRQHMYVLGKSGTGKSVMLENMIIQNIHQGEGVCVVDPHGELVEKILETIPKERINDVVYFNPADTDYNIGFNVLQLDDPRYKHLVASGLMGIFTKIWANAWSSRMEYILNNTILALLDTPDTTLLGIPRMLVDKDYRQYIINNLKDPVVKAFWVHEYEAWRDQFRNEAIAPIQNKVGQFLSSNIVRNVVGQTRSTINVFDIMNTKKIFLINVSKGRIGEDNSALLGGMLITKLQLSAMERVRIPENQREDFYLYVDEFQNFVTDSFASILSEARKYRLCLIIAHQYIAQLETADSKTVKDAVFGNVGTMVIFRVGADDADALEKEFEPEFTVEDFVNLPNYHIYNKLMVDGVTSRPFSAKTLPPVPVQSSDEIRQLVIETSRTNYTRARSEVEAEIHRWSSTVPGQTRPDGEETEGKFKASCSNCGKSIYVPFEPEAGRPIYCKECLFKIKNGEIEAAAGFRPPREKRDNVSYDALAALGIEFKNEPRQQMPRQDRPAYRPTGAPPSASFTPRHPVVEEHGPPQGMIRGDVKDVPKPLLKPDTQSMPLRDTGTMSVPAPRVVRAPIKKDRKGPDTLGLQSLLKEALGSTASRPVPPVPVKSEVAAAPKTVPQPALSLGVLKQKTAAQFVVPTKDALPERQNMLKDAISKAMGESVVEQGVKPEVLEKSESDNTQLEAQKKAAEERAIKEAEAERDRLRKELQEKEMKARELEAQKRKEEEARLQAEKEKRELAEREAREKAAKEAKEAAEKAKKEAEEKAAAEQKAALEQAQKKAEEERAKEEAERKAKEEALQATRVEEVDPAPKTKKTKEVPENLLKQILE